MASVNEDKAALFATDGEKAAMLATDEEKAAMLATIEYGKAFKAALGRRPSESKPRWVKRTVAYGEGVVKDPTVPPMFKAAAHSIIAVGHINFADDNKDLLREAGRELIAADEELVRAREIAVDIVVNDTFLKVAEEQIEMSRKMLRQQMKEKKEERVEKKLVKQMKSERKDVADPSEDVNDEEDGKEEDGKAKGTFGLHTFERKAVLIIMEANSKEIWPRFSGVVERHA